jgi:hypothetical protein
LPTPRRRPFQSDCGSHTSTSIWESIDGVSVASTRQKGRRFLCAEKNSVDLFPDSGGVKVPETVFALVIAV